MVEINNEKVDEMALALLYLTTFKFRWLPRGAVRRSPNAAARRHVQRLRLRRRGAEMVFA